MAESIFFPKGKNRRGHGAVTLVLVALAFTLIGILVASNLDFSPRSVADAPASMAQTSAFPVVDRGGEMESPFVAVVEQATDAVVNISARTRSQELPWWFQGGLYSTSLGSGFFFREDGYILTNAHVVANALELTVRTSAGYEYPAELVGSDPQTDIAVVKVDPEEEITVIPLGSSEKIKVGDWAIAIGNPFPQQGLDRSVTVGVISAKGRSNLRFGEGSPAYQDYIQTDASINPGNSGGPLLNLKGECIGINAAISSPTGSSVGIGFAIPIDMAKAIVPDLIATGEVERGWLGVQLSDVTEREAKRQGLPAVRGVHIDSVFSNSPAERAGIRRGDVVVSFNDQDVLNTSQFSVLVSTVERGEIVPVKIIRDGEPLDLTAAIADRDASLTALRESQQPQEVFYASWLGMELVTFTPELARDIGARHVNGVYVARVYAGTAADRASIAEGTVIMEANNEPVSSVADIRRIAEAIGNSKNKIAFIVQEPDGTIARKICRL
ncbi:MAG TPA: trypsin-like peptidase domain-containing protein [Acidobacteriota bacterium]|nr:trypsin-like peptidase domain-containing protein [Acidobacteriota bacterium]